MPTRCLECGGDLVRETRPVEFRYRGTTFTVDQPGDWCQVCGEGYLSPEDRKANVREIHDARAKIDHMLPAVEVRRVRRKLHLTQQVAGLLFGGGDNAFSRYERGLAMQPRSTDLLLRVLDRHPKMLDEIREFAPLDLVAAKAASTDEEEKQRA